VFVAACLLVVIIAGLATAAFGATDRLLFIPRVGPGHNQNIHPRDPHLPHPRASAGPGELAGRRSVGETRLGFSCPNFFSASAREAIGQPVVLVSDVQKSPALLRSIKGFGLLSQASGGVSISARPILVRLGDFHRPSGSWLDPVRSLTPG
jgi:hypothetical protein